MKISISGESIHVARTRNKKLLFFWWQRKKHATQCAEPTSDHEINPNAKRLLFVIIIYFIHIFIRGCWAFVRLHTILYLSLDKLAFCLVRMARRFLSLDRWMKRKLTHKFAFVKWKWSRVNEAWWRRIDNSRTEPNEIRCTSILNCFRTILYPELNQNKWIRS